jgi:hypothetical protein
MKNDYLDRLLA